MKFFTLLFIIQLNVFAADFFANPEVQKKHKHAFAIQPESKEFITKSLKLAKAQGDLLVKKIKSRPHLYEAIQNWETLSIDEQIPFLYEVFVLEYQSLNILPPKLVIDNDAIKGGAFFEFDLESKGTGTVYLNPKVLDTYKKYESIALLIHETRHSAQFQMAFNQKQTPLSIGYKNAFIAQKELLGKVGFCDFLTLNNEYEAFLFGNYVLGQLLDWKLDMPGMGTFASQFNSKGELKIDLTKIHKHFHGDEILKEFNRLEIKQKEILTR